VLDDDCRVGDQGPKVVGPDSGVPLEVLKKGGLVGVVVGVCTEEVCEHCAGEFEETGGSAHTTVSPRAASGSACASCSGSD
jgi:hypothetical protein